MKMPMCCDRRRYQQQWLMGAPIHYWPLNEPGGRRYNQISGGPDLQEITPTASTTGKYGDAAVFDKSLLNGLFCGAVLPDTYTISLWLNAAAATGSSFLLSETIPGTNYLKNALYMSGDRVSLDNFPPVGAVYGPKITLHTWHHIVVTQESGYIRRLYVDGSLGGYHNEQYTGPPVSRFCIGYRDAPYISYYALGGILDEIIIWDEVVLYG